MNPGTLAWHDQHDAWVADTIRRSGWAVNYIGGESCSRPGCSCENDEGPPFAYTVGLFGLGHPELLVFGLDPTTASQLLNYLGSRIKDGEPLVAGIEIEFDEWSHKVVPELVPNPGEIVFEANRFYQRPDEASVPVLQLSYNDPAGRYPWEDEYVAPQLQPRPGSFRA